MAKRDGIHYTVHPTPKRKGETEQTYHVRRHYFTTLKSEDIVDHIRYHGSIVDLATYSLVMESLKEEIVELLQSGHDLHIEGLGRFCLQLGTRKTRGKDGRMHAKRYLNPEDITAREVVVKGISFTPDKAMLKRIRDYHAHFQHDKGATPKNSGAANCSSGWLRSTRRTVPSRGGHSNWSSDSRATVPTRFSRSWSRSPIPNTIARSGAIPTCIKRPAPEPFTAMRSQPVGCTLR